MIRGYGEWFLHMKFSFINLKMIYFPFISTAKRPLHLDMTPKTLAFFNLQVEINSSGKFFATFFLDYFIRRIFKDK